jgi:NAD(P)-dependent dehydrogenase (short-subunit alcohol dehydrogenase family)
MAKPQSVRTVLITGCSTGIGRATAELFQRQGWNVSATMLEPGKETELHLLPNMICPFLDVNDNASIATAIKETLDHFGHIDAIVNNAGYGLIGAFETLSEAQIRRQFDTNVFGLMEVCRAILPIFRAQQRGMILNVSSLVGRIPLPLYSIYNASKFAVEGYSEGLIYELAPFNIRIKLIEPGAVKTDFFGGSSDRKNETGEGAYSAYAQAQMQVMDDIGNTGCTREQAAQIIYQAAQDDSNRLRYSVGMDAMILLPARRLLPDWLFVRLIKVGLSPSSFSTVRSWFYDLQKKRRS